MKIKDNILDYIEASEAWETDEGRVCFYTVHITKIYLVYRELKSQGKNPRLVRKDDEIFIKVIEA